MNRFILVVVILFFGACSHKNDILDSSLQKNHIQLSKKQKQELEMIYEKNQDFWDKHPKQIDIFIQNNFTKEAIYLRNGFIGKNIEEVQKTLSYEKMYIKKRQNYILYNFIQGMSEYSFVVENKIIKDVFIYDNI